jgi:pSer/pThr/pTyr-binding forkhead associated (FHA) protein
MEDRIRITVTAGPDKGREAEFCKSEIIIGRGEDCDFRLYRDKAVSGVHARLCQEDGQWVVHDLNSKNGVFVEYESERRRVDCCTLQHGSVICLGEDHLDVECIFLVAQPPVKVNQAQEPPEAPLEKRLLRISAGEERLKFQLITQGAVGAEHSLPYSSSDFHAVQEQLTRTVLQLQLKSDCPHVPELDLMALRELSDFLQYHFFPERIRNKLIDSSGGDLLLMLKPELLCLPWELTNVGDVPLCLKFNISRQLLTDDHSVVVSPRTNAATSQVLIVATPTGGLPDAYQHAEELFGWFRAYWPEAKVTFVGGRRASRIVLLRQIAAADLVYFIGHAEHDAANPSRSGWLLDNDRVTCADVQKMERAPTFVFANGCGTGSEEQGQNETLVHGMGSGFLMSGVQSYLGSAWEIPPGPAGIFAAHLFSNLLNHNSLAEAVRKSRQDLRACLSTQETTWASYVLYGNPGIRLI